MHVITAKTTDSETRFVVGCADMAAMVAERMETLGMTIVSIKDVNDPPQRSEVEMRRAQDIMYLLFSEVETEQ